MNKHMKLALAILIFTILSLTVFAELSDKKISRFLSLDAKELGFKKKEIITDVDFFQKDGLTFCVKREICSPVKVNGTFFDKYKLNTDSCEIIEKCFERKNVLDKLDINSEDEFYGFKDTVEKKVSGVNVSLSDKRWIVR